MININDLKSKNALTLLSTYKGINPYLLKLKSEYDNKGKVKLTETQVKYLIKFHDSKPTKVNKVVEITEYLGETLQKTNNLPFIPERILIQFILADFEKSYHVYGKLKQNQTEGEMYWLPKTQVLDDPYFEDCDVEVDWDKYTELDVLNRTPYEHQKKGIEFLLCRDGAILADDMGLGKTYQSIVGVLEKEAKKVLIICPASMKITWQRELECFGETGIVVSGSHWPHVGRFTIINFDILKNFHTIGPQTKDKDGQLEPHYRDILNEHYDLIIVDEAHKVKDHKSIRGKIVGELVNNDEIKTVWLLTGTPIANRPMDFYNLLKIVKSTVTDNWQYFAKRYCEGKQIRTKRKNRDGSPKKAWITKGASNLDELSVKTKNILLRRLKTEVLDMPDKTIVTNYHELSKRGVRDYELLWDDYVDRRKEEGKRTMALSRDLVELGLLRKFIAMESIPHTIDLIKIALEQNQKVVVFTTFTDELMEIVDNFGNECVMHNGKMNSNAKQESVDKFQNSDKVKIFVGNIASAGVGLTLTEGTIVIFNSFDWVPGNNEQAEDRCYRIGQQSNVTVYYQLFKDTVSMVMWYTLMKKQEVINKIIGSGSEEGKRLKNLMDNLEENGIALE